MSIVQPLLALKFGTSLVFQLFSCVFFFLYVAMALLSKFIPHGFKT